MKVLIPTPLYDYTGGKREFQSESTSLKELLLELDRRFPGIRFRMVDEQDKIRGHIRVFVDGVAVHKLETPLTTVDEVLIVQALSGG